MIAPQQLVDASGGNEFLCKPTNISQFDFTQIKGHLTGGLSFGLSADKFSHTVDKPRNFLLKPMTEMVSFFQQLRGAL